MSKKTIDTLAEDVLSQLNSYDTDSLLELVPKLDQFGVDVSKAIVRQMGNRVKVRDPRTLYASEIGKPCHRQIWYSYHKPELAEKMAPHTYLKFLYGDVLEELLLFLAEASGHTVEHKQHSCVAEYTSPDTGKVWHIRGRLDAVIDGCIVDVKSASSYSFRKFSTSGALRDDDPFGYIPQINFYDDGTVGSKTVAPESGLYFFVINKETGKLLVVEVETYINTHTAVIPPLVEALEGDIEVLKRMPTKVEKNGNEGLCVNCQYCPYKKTCWGKKLRVFMYAGGKPKFLVKVVSTPRVAEVTDVFLKEKEEESSTKKEVS